MIYEKDFSLKDTSDKMGLQKPCDMIFSYPAHFRLLIEGTKFEKVQYAVKSANVPEIRVTGASFPTRTGRDLEMSPDTIEYSPLTVQFFINDTFENYVLIHDWILGMIKEVNEGIKKRQLTLILLSGKFNSIKELSFVGAYPTSLSSVDYTYEEQDPAPLVASVSFNYDYYVIN